LVKSWCCQRLATAMINQRSLRSDAARRREPALCTGPGTPQAQMTYLIQSRYRANSRIDLSGAKTRIWRLTSGSSRCLVLGEEPAQDRLTPDPAMNRLGNRRCRARRPQPQCPMRPRGLVVGGVPTNHLVQVPLAENRHTVGDLGPHCQDEAFGQAVRPGPVADAAVGGSPPVTWPPTPRPPSRTARTDRGRRSRRVSRASCPPPPPPGRYRPPRRSPRRRRARRRRRR
jgi:hypothetical protein